jgi:hypothetical protein
MDSELHSNPFSSPDADTNLIAYWNCIEQGTSMLHVPEEDVETREK